MEQTNLDEGNFCLFSIQFYEKVIFFSKEQPLADYLTTVQMSVLVLFFIHELT